MRKKSKLATIVFVVLVLLGSVVAAFMFLQSKNIAVLNPKGHIASEQADLMLFATLLTAVVVIPVFALTFYISWKYRASNKKATYSPEWDRSRVLEFIWWVVPLLIISIISVVIWKTSQTLDPYKPIASNREPLTVQVVALDWRWLFIYPKENIATLSYLKFTAQTPLRFELTSDAPMNSFWIPQLGGQVYAMSGMKTALHLQASEQGKYQGSSANISGEGFAGMRFTAEATSQADFDDWVHNAKQSKSTLTTDEYAKLAKPSKNTAPVTFSKVDHSLFDGIIKKYMEPQGQEHGTMGGMGHGSH